MLKIRRTMYVILTDYQPAFDLGTGWQDVLSYSACFSSKKRAIKCIMHMYPHAKLIEGEDKHDTEDILEYDIRDPYSKEWVAIPRDDRLKIVPLKIY